MKCKYCQSDNIIKKGNRYSKLEKDKVIAQRYHCKDCDRKFSVPVDKHPRQRENVQDDKKLQSYNWRDISKWIQQGQEIHHNTSFSQDQANIKIDTNEPILIINIGDWHIGAKGTDYSLLEKYTEEIINTPNLYVIINSDMLETAINMRNVKEVTGQIIDPEMQYHFLTSWLKEIKHKIIAATWDNHTVMREEKNSGVSLYKRIIGLENGIIYHNGIGLADLTVGEQTYKLLHTHFFKGNSIYNDLHGHMRAMKFTFQDREIAMAGHTHKPAYTTYYDGNVRRLALNGGSLHTNSGYAKRFHSLFAIPQFPCFELYPNTHLFQPYMSIGEWKKVKANNV